MNTKTPNKLRQRLLELPFDAYLKIIALLLAKLGYQDVRLAGRTDWKGRNRGGGYDLLATVPGGFSPRRVIIQAKQFDEGSRVFQRQADELRGAAIRVGAAEALLITSGPLSASIDQEGLALPLAPVRIIGGDHLVELLSTHQIGVTPRGTLDEDFFKRLEQEAVGNRQSDCLGAKSELLLTVAVKRVPRRATRSHQSS
ncbi:restriction endonuclease [Armatimonas sp.]|uniref:restriction endonuclease n=1 Tax=Armatimonas sp. TaxID=1872638 RepID=UPI00286D4C4F|nr:restriction endonuclease [Armatimonas sp.]